MPMYQCFTPEGSLDETQRSSVATAFTNIHCSLTTAPPTFVHVLFHEYTPKWSSTDYAVHGGIRAGRAQSITDSLVDQMTTTLAETIGVSSDAVTMQTRETPASWIMEGGAVLPEPGDEAAWVGANA
jgi:phenylpyruvate tautomerase PptA (4-oxalocrotonate tautomerase family)